MKFAQKLSAHEYELVRPDLTCGSKCEEVDRTAQQS